MFSFIVITKYNDKQPKYVNRKQIITENGVVSAIILDEKFNIAQKLNNISAIDFLHICKQYSETIKPINFVFTENCIVESHRGFKYLLSKDSFILLNEKIDINGNCLGIYSLLKVSNNSIVNLSKQQIKKLYDKSNGTFNIYNAVIRETNNTFTISPYPHYKFNKVIVSEVKGSIDYEPKLILCGNEKDLDLNISTTKLTNLVDRCCAILSRELDGNIGYKGKKEVKEDERIYTYRSIDCYKLANLLAWLSDYHKKDLYYTLNLVQNIVNDKQGYVNIRRLFQSSCKEMCEYSPKFHSFLILFYNNNLNFRHLKEYGKEIL